MQVNLKLAALVAVAGLAAPVMAQDSVSNNPGGTDGDALPAYAAGASQRSAYVVDGSPLFGSRGSRYFLYPIAKTTKASSFFFNNLMSAQALSPTIISGMLNSSYSLWENQPGAGVNPAENDVPGSIVAEGPALQFSAAFSNFGTADAGGNYTGIVGVTAKFFENNPGRLYVTRVTAAENGATGTDNRASFGIGSIDAAGNTYFRADGFGATGPNAMVGNNVFRIALGARNTNGNVIDNTGSSQFGNGTSVRIVNNYANTINTPGNIPADLAGVSTGRALIANFDNQLGTETSPGAAAPGNMTYTSAHLVTNHRGGPAFTKNVLRGGVGTGAILMNSGSNLSVFGLSAAGAVLSPISIASPASASDCAGYTAANGRFDHYRSQVATNGGNSPVAVSRDPRAGTPAARQGLVAGVFYTGRGTGTDTAWPYNALMVGRFNPAASGTSTTAEWKVVAYTDFVGGVDIGSPITGDYGADGAPFTNDAGEFDDNLTNDAPIGRLANLYEVTGGAPAGPSISAPAFDSVGNVYFIASVALNKSGPTGPFVDFDSALIRAIYNPDTFCYTLELLAELGDTFDGPNSGRKYQLQFLGVADSNSVDSGTIFSGNITQAAFANTDPATLGTGAIEDTRALGGLVFRAEVTYDVNNDGTFDDPSSAGGDPSSPDESYAVLMYLGHRPTNTTPACVGDFNSDGFVDDTDFVIFANAYDQFTVPPADPQTDLNNDGFVDDTDFVIFAQAYDQFVCP